MRAEWADDRMCGPCLDFTRYPEWYDETHRRAVARIRRAFDQRAWTRISESRRPYLGLAHVVSWLYLPGAYPRRPWGWKRRKLYDRDVVFMMPLWLYWLVEAWEASYGVFPLLKRLGLWRTREGQLWTEGRITAPRWLRAIVWCFLNDRDEYEPWDFSRCYTWGQQWRVKNIVEQKEARPLLLDLPPYWGDESQYDVQYRIKSVPPRLW